MTSTPRSAPLPSIPDDLLAGTAQPRLGAYHGSVAEVDLRPRLGRGPLRHVRTILKLKRWQFVNIATPEVCLCAAVVDAGLAANGFFYVADLSAGRLVADRTRLSPRGFGVRLNDRPGEGAIARFDLPGHHIRLTRAVGQAAYELEIHSGDADVEAVLDASQAADPLTVLMPLTGGDLDFTQKLVLMPVKGTLRVGDRTWDLAKGYAGLDFTHGLFARKTAWRWGFGLGRTPDGTAIAFNVTDGLSDAEPGENVLWVGRQMIPIGRARFLFDAKRLEAAWQLHTEDGALDLRFFPKGIHREERNLIAVESHFAQIGGVFSGTIRDPRGQTYQIEQLAGVAEDQRVVW